VSERRIGDTTVSAIGLGGAGLSFADDLDPAEAEATIVAALEAGITYIDTAAAYTTANEPGHNERLISKVVSRSGRANVLIGTKGGHYRAGNKFPIDGRPESIRRDCEASLNALGLEALPLYFLHWPDPNVPFEDSVGAVEALRVEGKVLRTGVSNVNTDQFRAALAITPLSAIQNNFSPFNRDDLDLIDQCEKAGVTYTIYSPLGGRSRALPLRELLKSTATRAAAIGLTLEQVVLSWELQISAAVLPIVGSTHPATIRNSAAAADVVLDAATIGAIEADLAIETATSALARP
jgi:aryl-alcohol dehydrogenase-like predicted oxidoreductase